MPLPLPDKTPLTYSEPGLEIVNDNNLPLVSYDTAFKKTTSPISTKSSLFSLNDVLYPVLAKSKELDVCNIKS